MLLLLRPRFGGGGVTPTPTLDYGPEIWVEYAEILKKRKKQDDELKEALKEDDPIEASQVDDIIEEITAENSANETEENQRFTKPLNDEILNFMRISLELEKLKLQIAAFTVENELRQRELLRQQAIELQRQAIAKKILEMKEEEEVLLFLLLN